MMRNGKCSLIFVLDKKGNVLLLNRQNEPALGTWCGVGGHIENNETALQCAIREMKEETGIISNNINVIGYYDKIKSFICYIILDDLFYEMNIKTPVKITEEGILSIKPLEWVLNEENQGINKETLKSLNYVLKSIERNK